MSETLCTLLDIQIGIFELRDSARFISSIKRVRTRIPAFFSNRRKRAFCFGPPLSLSVDDEENEQDDDDDDEDDEGDKDETAGERCNLETFPTSPRVRVVLRKNGASGRGRNAT